MNEDRTWGERWRDVIALARHLAGILSAAFSRVPNTQWFERVALHLRAIGAFWDIPDHMEPTRTYLKRYYLLPGRVDKRTGKRTHENRLFDWFNVVLHNFKCSDDDFWHTHPWRFWLSIVLKRGYTEETPSGPHRRRAWSIAFRSGLSCHRVQLKTEHGSNVDDTWTLFLMGPKWITWGFYLDGVRKWVPYFVHLMTGEKRQHYLRRWWALRSRVKFFVHYKRGMSVCNPKAIAKITLAESA